MPTGVGVVEDGIKDGGTFSIVSTPGIRDSAFLLGLFRRVAACLGWPKNGWKYFSRDVKVGVDTPGDSITFLSGLQRWNWSFQTPLHLKLGTRLDGLLV